MDGLSKNINKLDLFGKLFIFEEKEHQKFSTFGGAILTFIIITTCIVIGFLFGREIYQRKNPTVINSNERISESRINVNEFPIFYAIIDDNSVNLPLAKKYIGVEINSLIIDENFEVTNLYYYDYKTCNVSDYTESYQSYIEEIYSTTGQIFDLYCILYSEEMYIQNAYSTPNSAYVNLQFDIKDGDFNDDELEERKNMLDFGVYITILYTNSYIDSSDYDNPINFYQSTNIQKISSGLLQRHFFNIEKINFTTNQGWILENALKKEVLTVQAISKDTSSSDKELFWVSFCSTNIRTKIVRSYMKLQDMLANVGGFFNALYIISMLLSKNYVDFSFYKYVYKYFSYMQNHDSNNELIKDDKFIYKVPIDTIAMKIAKISNNNESSLNFALKNKSESIINKNLIKIGTMKNVENIENIDVNNCKEQKNMSNSNNKLISNNFIEPNNLINNKQQTKENIADIKKTDNNNNNNNNVQNKNKILPLQNFQMNRVNNANNNIINTLKEEEYKIFNSSKNQNNSLENNINYSKNVLMKKNSNNLLEYIKNISYLKYIWNDIICCRDMFKYQRKAVANIISFENMLEVSYNHYIENKFIHH